MFFIEDFFFGFDRYAALIAEESLKVLPSTSIVYPLRSSLDLLKALLPACSAY
jgi:hypothetical protein